MLRIVRFIVNLFISARRYLVHVDEAIEVVQSLKAAVNSRAAIRLTEIIPGEWDNLLRVKLSYALAKAATVLGKVAGCEEKLGEDKIACYLVWLRVQPDEVRAMNYARIALMVARELMESFRLTDAELNAVIQTRYVQRKEDKNDTAVN
jgi:hypothetical protein